MSNTTDVNARSGSVCGASSKLLFGGTRSGVCGVGALCFASLHKPTEAVQTLDLKDAAALNTCRQLGIWGLGHNPLQQLCDPSVFEEFVCLHKQHHQSQPSCPDPCSSCHHLHTWSRSGSVLVRTLFCGGVVLSLPKHTRAKRVCGCVWDAEEIWVGAEGVLHSRSQEQLVTGTKPSHNRRRVKLGCRVGGLAVERN